MGSSGNTGENPGLFTDEKLAEIRDVGARLERLADGLSKPGLMALKQLTILLDKHVYGALLQTLIGIWIRLEGGDVVRVHVTSMLEDIIAIEAAGRQRPS